MARPLPEDCPDGHGEMQLTLYFYSAPDGRHVECGECSAMVPDELVAIQRHAQLRHAVRRIRRDDILIFE